MLNPTFDVDVAWARMLSPLTVVVPKPVPEIVRAEVVVVERPETDVVEKKRSDPALRKVHCATPAPADSESCGAVEEAMTSE